MQELHKRGLANHLSFRRFLNASGKRVRYVHWLWESFDGGGKEFNELRPGFIQINRTTS